MARNYGQYQIFIIKGPVTQCNFSCKFQRRSTLGRYIFPPQFANSYIFLTHQTFVTNLHLLRVELRWKLQGELPCDRALKTLVICIHMLCMVNFATANIYYLHENALTCDLNKNYMTTEKTTKSTNSS